MNEIYLDNSATTRPSEAVLRIMEKTLREDFGNPSSMHRKGVEAEQYVRDARKILSRILKVSEGEIYFTSGGTEGNNWAIIGGAMAQRRAGNRIITTEMEHPAVAEPFAFLEKQGFEVVKIPVDKNGVLDLAAFREALTEDTVLVSAMYVNNEIGAVVPVEELSALIRQKAPKAYFHVDAIQAFGKYRIYPRTAGIDLLSVSAHKFHGPKGVGFLYIRDGVRTLPLIYGGGQQGGMRSGTENVPGIEGLGAAAEEAYTDFEEKVSHLYALKERLRDGLSAMDHVTVHGLPGREGAPHIVNAAFPGVGAEVLLHALEDRGILISAGSACSTHKRAASPTLSAIRAPKKEAESSVRFSFSEENTFEEVDETLKALGELLPVLRRYRAR